MRFKQAILAGVLFVVAGIPASGDTVSFYVSVDTSSQAGNTGYLDIELNPGTLSSLPITAVVSGFTGDRGLVWNDANMLSGETGDVSGMLPGSLTFFNDQTLNDYTEALTFGNSVSFTLTLSGAGVDPMGNAHGTSGTGFQLDFGDPTFNSYLLTNDPGGNVFVIGFDNMGLVTVTTNPDMNGNPSLVTAMQIANSNAPEPAAWWLTASGLAGMTMRRRLHRRRRPLRVRPRGKGRLNGQGAPSRGRNPL